MSEFALNKFQEKTVKHICEYLQSQEHNVYLLADETGIGKTVIASEVAKRITESNKKQNPEQRVLYIASSLELANENIQKLKFEGAEVIQGRLSMLWKNYEDISKSKQLLQESTKLFALTPAVSLTMDSSGTDIERTKCHDKFWKLQEKGEKIGNQELIDKIKKLDELIAELQKIKSKDAEKNYIGNKYGALLARHANKSTQLFKEINADFSRTKKYKEIAYTYDLQKDIDLVAQQVIAIYLVENVQRYMLYENQPKDLDDIIKLKCIADIVKKLVKGTSVLQKYYEILWGKSKDEVKDNLWENPKELVSSIAGEIKKNWGNISKIICTDNDIYRQLLIALEDIYWSDYYKLIRSYMAYYSLVEYVKPNVVIIDEIQNYPYIFSDIPDADEDSAVIKQILDEVLGRNKADDESHNDVKVLMLSATPYAYRNAIEIEEDHSDTDEIDSFMQHLVGMEDILSYMKRQNNSKVDVDETWKEVQEKLSILNKNSLKQQKIDEKKYQDAKESIGKLEKEMCNLGISRSERPKKTYKPDEGKYVINGLKVSELANYFVKNKKVCGTRLSLSLPRELSADDIKGCGYKIYEGDVGKVSIDQSDVYSSRIEALLNDLFADNAFLYLFVPPNRPTKELKGVYINSERKYGKTLLFSAYNAVPLLLKKSVDERLCQQVIKYSINNNIWRTEEEFQKAYQELDKNEKLTFKNYMNGTNLEKSNEPDMIRNLNISDEMKSMLYEMFTTEYARRIILSLYGEKAIEDYSFCVDEYCCNGNFSAVIEEFEYMCSLQKGNPTIESCLSDADSNDAKAFSVSYCSSMVYDFEKKIRSFNNPFYPFVFFITSMAEEGHDFHWYSDRIVHWNVPTSPISLIQREGRIDRADCMAIRKAIAEAMKEEKGDSWEDMCCRFYKNNIENIKNDLYKSMFPKFITCEGENRIYRGCYYYPLSSEYFRWEILMKNLEYYRSMFGACDSVQIQELVRTLNEENVWKCLKELQLDIHVK